ncbi:hypothetical protein [Bacillus sp. EB600]|uniref:hypothetical protein n=1 Tax=Bacillus sp. EB600 TaxID=2806345 RepID=UPI0021092D7A|nr:hypothetical protein [Bacillus sp. EB600]MCQ6280777.1 hypothetical protein [Bacillus sp. EB600]
MDQENLQVKIDELFQKINKLEKSLQEKHNHPFILKMDVKNLHLQQLNLEELAFHLDKLDIKELSGMLNLGNTFSPHVLRKPMSKKPSTHENTQKQGEMAKGKNEQIQIKINGKSVPYSIN